MADDDVSDVQVQCSDCDEGAPHQWIYQNLTPWRIHAWFKDDGSLWPRRHKNGNGGEGRPLEVCHPCVANVLSIPALGEVAVPHEDAVSVRHAGHAPLGSARGAPGAERVPDQAAAGRADLRLAGGGAALRGVGAVLRRGERAAVGVGGRHRRDGSCPRPGRRDGVRNPSVSPLHPLPPGAERVQFRVRSTDPRRRRSCPIARGRSRVRSAPERDRSRVSAAEAESGRSSTGSRARPPRRPSSSAQWS